MKKNRYLVAGACGFIGSNYVLHLVNDLDVDPKNIWVIDAFTYAAINLHRLPNDIDIINNDIAGEGTKDIIDEFDPTVIVNFAAETHVDNSIESHVKFVDSNVLGVLNLGKLAAERGIRLIQISTDEVYGDTDFSSTYAFHPDDMYSPSNPYSATKASADLIIMSLRRTFGLKATTIRMCNNYGPGQNQEKFVPVVINSILDGKEIPLYGKGKNIREWIFVEDAVKMIEGIIEVGKEGKIYHIGTDIRINNKKMIETIIDVMKAMREKNIKTAAENATIKNVSDRSGHDRRYALNSSETYNLFSKKYDIINYTGLTTGIRKTILDICKQRHAGECNSK